MKSASKAFDGIDGKFVVQAFEKETGKDYHAVKVGGLLIALEKKDNVWKSTPGTISNELTQQIGTFIEVNNL